MQFIKVTLGRSVLDNVPMLMNVESIVSVVPDEVNGGSILTLLNKNITVMEPFDFLLDALYNDKQILDVAWEEPPKEEEETTVTTEESVATDAIAKDKKRNTKESGEEKPPVE